MHPSLHLQFFQPKKFAPTFPPNCKLISHLTLPSYIFPDKYQLSQSNLLRSNNLIGIRALSPSQPDLEAPDWSVREWGTTLLLELARPDPGVSSWTAELPLHLRYMPPTSPSSHHESSSADNANDNLVTADFNHRILRIPAPLVFWACPTTIDGPELDTNPFDRTNLGYDTAFGRRTAFWHLKREGPALQIEVPVLNLDRARYVERGTVIAALAGFVWICWCLARVSLSKNTGSGASTRKMDRSEVVGKKDQ